MSKHTFTFELERENPDDTVTIYEVEVDYLFEKGRYYGPPEDCFPTSEEFEVTQVSQGGKIVSVKLTQSEEDSLYERAVERARDQREYDDDRE